MGEAVGDSEGTVLGLDEGDKTGEELGLDEGEELGEALGLDEGVFEGLIVGESVAMRASISDAEISFLPQDVKTYS